jgi:hypothetical protein
MIPGRGRRVGSEFVIGRTGVSFSRNVRVSMSLRSRLRSRVRKSTTLSPSGLFLSWSSVAPSVGLALIQV